MKKEDEYAKKILNQLIEMFDEDCEHYINSDELSEDNNLNSFVHALATLAPTMLTVNLTGQTLDMLAFNHMANRLCFQLSKDEENNNKP